MNRRLFQMTDDMTPQAKNALRISLIGLLAAILTASVYLVMAIQFKAWQLYAWSADIWVLALAVFIGIPLIRRGRVATGIWILLATLQITFLVAVALIDGTGLIIGISITILVAVVAGQTLSTKQVNLAILLGIASGIAAILLELFPPTYRFPQPPFIRIYLPGVLIVVILLFGYVTAQQFRNYLLRTKLIVIFIMIVVSSIGVVAFLSGVTLQSSLTEDVGSQLNTLAKSKASEIGQALDRESDILKTLTYNKLAQELATSSNEQGPLSQTEIDQLDSKWLAADTADNNFDPLVSSVLINELGEELREFQKEFPHHIEIFLTNQQGINIASTNRTSDYYQADEEWWQIAYQDGLFIGQPEYDESSNAISIIMAASVYAPDSENAIGVLRTTVNLAALTDSLASGLFGQTGHTDIYLPNGQEIELRVREDGTYETVLVDAELDINSLSQSTDKYLELIHNNVPTLASQSVVNVPGDVDEDIAVISNLNWRVVAFQDQSEAFQAIETQTRNLILLAIAISIIVTFVAIGMAQVISAPITRLNTVANKIASGELSVQANVETGDEIGTLATTFNKMTSQLNELIGTLEHRVSERTADAELARLISERRAQELQAISEVSRTISTEQRLDILLPLVTRLVSEKFDFYHVGIFFVDDTQQFAVLQASNSEGGKRMIERSHRLEVGQTGIVGNVAQSGKPRIALDVGSDAVFFSNPDLPNTRSEMALPLNVRGKTVGVMDVQSVNPGAFTESDANTLSILADQVAIAIDNARLFGQSQEALNEVQKLNRQFQSQEWSQFMQQETQTGYRQSIIGGKPLETLVESDEIQKTLQLGEVVVSDGKNEKSQPSISVPVKLRGQIIGVLNIKAPTKNRKWNQDEINLAQAVSDRLGLALDNARLLQDSQRRAAKEQKIGEVTARIGASINMRNVLQTAVEELGRALPGSEVVIQFKDADGEKSQ